VTFQTGSDTIATRASRGEQIDDVLDSSIGAVICGFQPAGWLVTGGRTVMEAAMGEWAAEPFVEEEKEQCNLHAFRGETVGVAGAITL
jgi:hypothetical protein